MARTELTRCQHDRAGGRCASDLTDAEWAVIAPLRPARKTTGRPRTTGIRDVVDAILCIATTGCQWRILPKDFPPVPTLRGCFCGWRNDGLLEDLNRRLVGIARLSPGRKARPRAGIIDRQGVKTSASGGVCGYDAGKRIKASKRHIVTDRVGVPVGLGVHSAASQDRDGAPNVLDAIAKRYPTLRNVFADGGYAGTKLGEALKQIGRHTLQISKRPEPAEGFEALPRRRVGERTLAWPGRCRRLSKDWVKSIASAEARVPIAHIRRGTRCLAKV